MKLAEALVLRADHQKKLEQLKARLVRNAKVQEGEQPAERPDDLLEEYERVAAEFQRLIHQINLTNAQTIVNGTSLTAALAERDVLRLRQGVYRDLANAASVTQSISTRSEVRFKSTVSVAAIQKQSDELAKALRTLDARIQEVNWKIDLID